MASIASILCCIPRNRHQNNTLPPPPETQIRYQSPPAPHMAVGPARRNFDHPGDVDVDDYAPPPRYTSRPADIVGDEKLPTFEQTQSLTNRRSFEYPLDEKTPLDFAVNEARTNFASDRSSDASSTFSVPSSFGNTSTATTETPPPPYSSRSSRAPSRRSFSTSIYSNVTGATQASDILPITQPPPALRRGHNGQPSPRTSVEQPRDRRSFDHSPFPPAYSRP
ncbi:predicted protein [Uncinocarpus reesii 1704]|uniref:Uncharacterized protein n=1 Tax=Uncinocarpus reesii (strain UAMH 1704) TaxID=336963 RepID=C4JF55_UNCRE|nr:uncharacterized protein UREG_02277 [Uncinocarpus reesii 1704]EEP77428.1 predicted protein [Uncinocarpus reesii 1704]